MPLLAQIVGIIDVYDALTSARPYRPALTSGTAIRHLLLQVEQRKFSRGLVNTFVGTLDKVEETPQLPEVAACG